MTAIAFAQYSSGTKSEEESYPVQLCIELALGKRNPLVVGSSRSRDRQAALTIFHRHIRPADDTIAPEERQRVVT